jgi:ER-bound oxygenase mpaB/B'/Rubber oxygenase, catalytic domain/Kelch motif
MASPIPDAGLDAPAFVRHGRGRRAGRARDQRDSRAGPRPASRAGRHLPGRHRLLGPRSRLLCWVHATLLDSFLLTYELYVGPLTAAEKNGYCGEASQLAPWFEIPEGFLPASAPRSAVAWGVHGGRIYIAGGEFQDSRLMAAFRALEAYDPATNTWTVLPQLPIPRHGLAGDVIGNRLHLVSGDVQSAGIAGMSLHSDSHDAFELGGQ